MQFDLARPTLTPLAVTTTVFAPLSITATPNHHWHVTIHNLASRKYCLHSQPYAHQYSCSRHHQVTVGDVYLSRFFKFCDFCRAPLINLLLNDFGLWPGQILTPACDGEPAGTLTSTLMALLCCGRDSAASLPTLTNQQRTEACASLAALRLALCTLSSCFLKILKNWRDCQLEIQIFFNQSFVLLHYTWHHKTMNIWPVQNFSKRD